MLINPLFMRRNCSIMLKDNSSLAQEATKKDYLRHLR